jgi:nucleoid DNA-binding protein
MKYLFGYYPVSIELHKNSANNLVDGTFRNILESGAKNPKITLRYFSTFTGI